MPYKTLQAVYKKVEEAFVRFIKGDKNGKRSGRPRFVGCRKLSGMEV
ncbi:hypothetical protein ACE1CM_06015 [Microseira sp. BLCC-F43]